VLSQQVLNKMVGGSGEKEQIGRGVSSCAPCDAPFSAQKSDRCWRGDSAMEEACVLTRFADE